MADAAGDSDDEADYSKMDMVSFQFFTSCSFILYTANASKLIEKYLLDLRNMFSN